MNHVKTPHSTGRLLPLSCLAPACRCCLPPALASVTTSIEIKDSPLPITASSEASGLTDGELARR